MSNPFKEIKTRHEVTELVADFEEIEGSMRCQTTDCGETVHDGYYSSKQRVLTWKCSKGHISRMDNIDV